MTIEQTLDKHLEGFKPAYDGPNFDILIGRPVVYKIDDQEHTAQVTDKDWNAKTFNTDLHTDIPFESFVRLVDFSTNGKGKLNYNALLEVAKKAPAENRPGALNDLIEALAGADRVTIETVAAQVKSLKLMSKTAFNEAIRDKQRQIKRERIKQAAAREADDNDSWPYEVKQNQIVYRTYNQSGELESYPVAAFAARITSEITNEYGERFYRIEGQTNLGRPFSLEIRNDDFASNAKLTAALTGAAGAKAPVMARMDPHLRPAIQKLTQGEIKQIARYDRTGWAGDKFLIPGRLPDGVNISLPQKLPYTINPKADLEKGLEGLKSLILSMPPEQSTVAAVVAFQAPLAKLAGWLNERYALFITGRTGSYKSSFAQVLMSLWGEEFMNDHQLVKWGEGATRNAIMAYAAAAHDMPLLIDNYKPNTGGGVKAFVNLVHNIVEGGEKDRLNRNSELKETKPVFCWPIFTGEDVPDTDPASLARILVVKFGYPKGQTNGALTGAQQLAPHLQVVGNAWLEWLESDRGKQAAADAKARFEPTRDTWALSIKQHQPDTVNIMRLATNLATNELTYDVMMKHPDLNDIFKPLAGQHLEGLNTIANSMADTTASSLEAHRFIETLTALCNADRLKFTARADQTIHDPDKHIGWKDNDGYYLVPDLAIAAVLGLMGKNYLNDISKQNLYSQLDELGYVASRDEKHSKTTINKWIAGKSNRVLHLKPDALMADRSQEQAKE